MRADKIHTGSAMTKKFFIPEPHVIAHRGAPLEFPENTLPSFKRAVEIGVDVIETDIHLTRDKKFVHIHDDDLERLAGRKGRVGELSLAELKKLDAGYSFSADGGKSFPFRGKGACFMSLEEALEEFPSQRFNIDLKDKNPEQVAHYVDTLRRMNAEERVLSASEHAANNRLVREMLPGAASSFALTEALWFYFLFKSGLILFKKHFAPDALQIPEYMGPSHVASETFVRAAHERGIRVHVWTVNAEKDMRRLFEAGVDGVISDDPGLLKKIAGEYFPS